MWCIHDPRTILTENIVHVWYSLERPNGDYFMARATRTKHSPDQLSFLLLLIPVVAIFFVGTGLCYQARETCSIQNKVESTPLNTPTPLHLGFRVCSSRGSQQNIENKKKHKRRTRTRYDYKLYNRSSRRAAAVFTRRQKNTASIRTMNH